MTGRALAGRGVVLPGVPESVRRARAVVRRALGDWPGADAAVLAVSELASNAVCSTRSGLPGGTFAVAVRAVAGGVEVAVLDGGGAAVPVLASPGPGDEHGRGLQIVASLGEWGSSRARGGRVTWCRIPAGPAGTGCTARDAHIADGAHDARI